MSDYKFDKETQAYFDSLPKIVQQTVVMSDVKINNINDLKAIAEGFTEKTDET